VPGCDFFGPTGTLICLAAEMCKRGASDCVDEKTPLYSSDSLEGAAKGLNAAVQRRHQHMRISCNSSLDDSCTTSVSIQTIHAPPLICSDLMSHCAKQAKVEQKYLGLRQGRIQKKIEGFTGWDQGNI